MKTIENIQDGRRYVAYDSNRIMRAVVHVNGQGHTTQATGKSDLIVSSLGGDRLIIWIDGRHVKEPINLNFISEEVKEFLSGKNDILPAAGRWDGSNTVVKLSQEYGLDKFFKDTHESLILAGLVDIVAAPHRAYFNNLNTKTIYKKRSKSNKHLVNIKTVLGPIEDNYDNWISNKKPTSSTPNLSWRNAKRMPEYLSVSCIKNDNGTHRYNELIVYRSDGSIEIVNVFDLVSAFGFPDNNFIVLPYHLDESVVRVAYILHDETKTQKNDTTVWLYRKR